MVMSVARASDSACPAAVAASGDAAGDFGDGCRHLAGGGRHLLHARQRVPAAAGGRLGLGTGPPGRRPQLVGRLSKLLRGAGQAHGNAGNGVVELARHGDSDGTAILLGLDPGELLRLFAHLRLAANLVGRGGRRPDGVHELPGQPGQGHRLESDDDGNETARGRDRGRRRTPRPA